jgi:hypothetical protein
VLAVPIDLKGVMEEFACTIHDGDPVLHLPTESGSRLTTVMLLRMDAPGVSASISIIEAGAGDRAIFLASVHEGLRHFGA